jgi:hypothetical protein
MKRAMLVIMFVLAVSGLMMAQTWSSPVDVLGAHNNQGRGCAGCHSPHSGSFGSGHARKGKRYWQLCIVGTGRQPTVWPDHQVRRQRKLR